MEPAEIRRHEEKLRRAVRILPEGAEHFAVDVLITDENARTEVLPELKVLLIHAPGSQVRERNAEQIHKPPEARRHKLPEGHELSFIRHREAPVGSEEGGIAPAARFIAPEAVEEHRHAPCRVDKADQCFLISGLQSQNVRRQNAFGRKKKLRGFPGRPGFLHQAGNGVEALSCRGPAPAVDNGESGLNQTDFRTARRLRPGLSHAPESEALQRHRNQEQQEARPGFSEKEHRERREGCEESKIDEMRAAQGSKPLKRRIKERQRRRKPRKVGEPFAAQPFGERKKGGQHEGARKQRLRNPGSKSRRGAPEKRQKSSKQKKPEKRERHREAPELIHRAHRPVEPGRKEPECKKPGPQESRLN